MLPILVFYSLLDLLHLALHTGYLEVILAVVDQLLLQGLDVLEVAHVLGLDALGVGTLLFSVLLLSLLLSEL